MKDFNQENVDLVLTILDNNGVKYNKGIRRYFANPADDLKCQELAGDFFDMLYELAEDGVNKGFDKNKKKNIVELTDQITFQNQSKAKETKYQNDSIKVRDRIRNEMNVKGNLSQDAEIIIKFGSFVNRTINATKVFLEASELKEKDVELINAGVEQLQEILNQAQNIMDYSSANAKQSYKYAYDKIVVWANAVANKQLTKSTNSNLADALNCVNNWATLVTYNPSTEAVVEPTSVISDLDRVKKILQTSVDQFEGIKNSFEYRKDAYNELEEQVAKLTAELQEIENQKSELKSNENLIISKYQNGEISVEMGKKLLKENDIKIKRVESQITTKYKILAPFNKRLDVQRVEIDNIEGKFELIETLAKEPLRFFYVINERKIDMTVLQNYFAGKITSSDEIELAAFQLRQLENGFNENQNVSMEMILHMNENSYVEETMNLDEVIAEEEVSNDEDLLSRLNGGVKEETNIFEENESANVDELLKRLKK